MAHDCGLDDSTLAGGFPGDELCDAPVGLHVRQYNAGPQVVVFDGSTPVRLACKADLGLPIGPDIDCDGLRQVVDAFNGKSSGEWPAKQRAETLIDALNAPGSKVVHGALQAAIVAQANDIDAKAVEPFPAVAPTHVPDSILDEVGRELSGLEAVHAEPPAAEPAPTNQLLRQFAQLQLRRRELEEALEVVTKGITALEPEILEYFADQGIQSANVLGLCCYMKTDFFVSKKADKDGVTTQIVCDAMRDFGLGYMVADGYNAASLKSKIKEWLKEGVEVPERLRSLLNIGETTKIATRKS